MPLSRYDIYVNVVGGLRITETSSDLAVVFAIASSLKEKTIGEKTVVIGEVGLTGEIRNITQIEQRLNEANKLGWINGIVPNQSFVVPKGFNPIKVEYRRSIRKDILIDKAPTLALGLFLNSFCKDSAIFFY